MQRPGDETSVATRAFEEAVVRQVSVGLDVMHCVESRTTVYILLSVIYVKGWILDYWDEEAERHFTFDCDVRVLPDIVLQTQFVPQLQPVFDTFWQAAGVSRSIS
jgi:hypothetical protein